ncbi:MAG: hypothetical protein JKY46_00385 [Robiginitomaculum sp.]|nr:hypothetical protein [Robiginitomaculum sp.]
MHSSPLDQQARQGKWGWLVLLTSSTTLICCALPIVLVSIGAGALSAALFANLPFLVVMAKYKLWMFLASGSILMFSAWLLYRPGRSCPSDVILAAECQNVVSWNRKVVLASSLIWLIGFSASYLALPLYNWLG